MSYVGEESLQECLDPRIKGTISYRKDFAYKNDLLLQYNARVIHYPVAFVHPIDVFDVQSAIKCGAMLNFTVIPRSGGHSDESYSIGDRDCILIVDLRYMSKIIIDTTTQTAKIETGNTLNTLYYSLNEHVFAFPSGECSTTGVAGIILGGGHGYLMRKFGMSCDNILDAQIVLANGTIVNHAKEYPELFWALRGAGNAGYGIVTTLTLKIYPIPKIVTSMVLTYDFYQTQLVYSVINKLGNSFHQNLTLMFDHQNDVQFEIRGYYLGSLKEAKPHIQKLIDLAKPKNELYVEGDWYNRLVVNTVGNRGHYKDKSFYIGSSGLSYEGVEYLMEFMKNLKRNFLIRTMLAGGRVDEIGRNETAFVHRGLLYMLLIEVTLDEDNYEIRLKDLEIFSRVFQKNYTSFESYQNHIDKELDNWQCRYYAENFRKLVEIKQKYDPNNLFNWSQSIPTSNEILCY
ncbi:6303_t:CDS:2 [Cetraspora pellucida]|uniref:6303_t:CDS:1 n=1 Tax=Cetraspora pellucida TaxID=1433469 RepID=A0A9N9CYR8_9GLOM|nr:6303_t:CDS:2 [Cetraspora pellucida]